MRLGTHFIHKPPPRRVNFLPMELDFYFCVAVLLYCSLEVILIKSPGEEEPSNRTFNVLFAAEYNWWSKNNIGEYVSRSVSNKKRAEFNPTFPIYVEVKTGRLPGA